MKNQDETPPITQDVDQGRRRLTKAGLAAPVVLGVLASRPVLGQSLHNCTPSGHISGFASPNPKGTVCSSLGYAPLYYARGPSVWPTGFTTTGGAPGPLAFTDAPSGLSVTFDDAYVVLYDNNPSKSRSATVWDVLKGDPVLSNGNLEPNAYLATRPGFTDDPDFTLGKEAIAACMNAMAATGYPQGFPISATQVVNMFNNVIITGGTDPVTSTANWNATEVIEYFQSLHG